jgi:hypothetical protein
MDFDKLDSRLKYIAENSPLEAGLGDTNISKESEMLQRFGYINIENKVGITYLITPSGMKFYLEGGFKGFIDRSEVAQSDIEWRIKLNKWLYRCRLAPYIISVISLLFSVLVFIISRK